MTVFKKPISEKPAEEPAAMFVLKHGPSVEPWRPATLQQLNRMLILGVLLVAGISVVALALKHFQSPPRDPTSWQLLVHDSRFVEPEVLRHNLTYEECEKWKALTAKVVNRRSLRLSCE